jgi:hypothetical protein
MKKKATITTKRNERLVQAIAASLSLAAILFVPLCVTLFAAHDHQDDDCAGCRQVERILDLQRRMSADDRPSGSGGALAAASPAALPELRSLHSEGDLTLVETKIRLNN